MNKYLFAVAGILLLVGAGCSNVPKETNPVDEQVVMEEGVVIINVEGENYSFSPNIINVNEGDKVVVNFKSTEGYHDFVVDEFSAKTKKVNTGGETSVTFTANKAGEFEYYCSVGSHRSNGMIGKLIVKAKSEGEMMVKEDKSEVVVEDVIVGEGDTMKPVENQDEVMIKDEDSMEDESEVMEAKRGTYEEYSTEKLNLANDGKVVLFFKANWCPTCKTADKNIESELDSIPENVHILKVDYDKSTDLKKKYGVTYQHTFVQVDARGELITKWSSSRNVADIVDKIK